MADSSLLQSALKSSHAHLVFKNRQGEPLDFAVSKLWTNEQDVIHCPRTDTLAWEAAVAVTNDMDILRFLNEHKRPIPFLPMAGDRPACYLNPMKLKVGVVNAGGPAPGLNMVNDSIVKRYFALAREAKQKNRDHEIALQIHGYLGGYQGLAEGEWKYLVPADGEIPKHAAPENWLVTDKHALDAATFLHSSRFDIDKTVDGGKPFLDAVVKRLSDDEIDVLHVLGGDGSLKGAMQIKRHFQRTYSDQKLSVVCGAKTMDYDLQYADATFGFTTTVDHAVQAIRTFHTTIDCLNRLGLMQLFGAASGFVALQASYASGEVDYVIIPEEVERTGLRALLSPDAFAECVEEARFSGLVNALSGANPGFDMAKVYEIGLAIVLDNAWNVVRGRIQKRGHALVVVAEGAKGSFKHSGKSQETMTFAKIEQFFKDRLTAAAEKNVAQPPHGSAGPAQPTPAQRLARASVTSMEPRYIIRDNPPQSFDIDLCKMTGKAMADAALAGYTDCAVTRWCGQYVLAPLHLVTRLTNRVDPRDYYYRTMIAKYQYAYTRTNHENSP